MSFQYWKYDATALAEFIREKKISSRELLDAVITRIEKINPSINAIINKIYNQNVDEPKYTGFFFGVPVLTKDISQEIEGYPITSGSNAYRGYVAKEDSEFVRRLKRSGVTIIGQTNVPEFALMGITEPAAYGPTRNPWNTNLTPGGSSGGAAAAIAAGLVPIAGANDGGGSIRIPASYCGLFGMKPTRGRTPVGKEFGRLWQGASSEHILSRSVRDNAQMLDLLKGYEKGAAFAVPPFHHNYVECAKTPPTKKLRIAYTVNSPIHTQVHQDCQNAVFETIQVLESLGHHVEEREAPVNGMKLANSYMTMYFGEVAATIASLEDVLGRPAKREDVEPTTWLLGLLGKHTNAEDWVLALREWDKAAYIMEEFHETYDLYVTPTTALPAATIGELEITSFEKNAIALISSLRLGSFVKKSSYLNKLIYESFERTPFTQLANLTGQPAMSVPFYLSSTGLPVGVQFMAAKGREDVLFSLAGVLEMQKNWIDLNKCPMMK